MINCNCYDVAYNDLSKYFSDFANATVTPCYNTTHLSCMSTQQTNFAKYGITNYSFCDDTKCPTECEMIRYDLTTSSAYYPTPFYLGWLQLQPAFMTQFSNQSSPKISTDIQDSILQLNIFYDDMGYTFLEDSPKITLDSLLGFSFF